MLFPIDFIPFPSTSFHRFIDIFGAKSVKCLPFDLLRVKYHCKQLYDLHVMKFEAVKVETLIIWSVKMQSGIGYIANSN